jgi:hypothetical protein
VYIIIQRPYRRISRVETLEILQQMAMARFLGLGFLFVFAVIAGQAMAAPKKPIAVARREDIPYIKCGVCEQIVKQLDRQVTNKRNQIAPKRLSEYQIIEVAENICNLKKEEGDWLLHLDIVEVGDKLKLVEQEQEGDCNAECKTIERTCQEVIGYHDTDIAEFLFKSEPQSSSLLKFLCNDLSKACLVKPPPVPKDRTPGEPFVPKSSKEAEMEKIMRSMSGMPGASNMKMYSKDDLMNMPNFGSNGEDEDDEEDEDDDYTSSRMRNTKRPLVSVESDWKKSLLDRVQSTFSNVKDRTQHAVLGAKWSLDRISDKIRKWYKGRKSSSKPSKSQKVEL